MAWIPRVEVKHYRNHVNIATETVQSSPDYRYQSKVQLPPNIYKVNSSGEMVLDKHGKLRPSTTDAVYPFGMVLDDVELVDGPKVDVVVLSIKTLKNLVKRVNYLLFSLTWDTFAGDVQYDPIDIRVVTIDEIIGKLNYLEDSAEFAVPPRLQADPNPSDVLEDIYNRIIALEEDASWGMLV